MERDSKERLDVTHASEESLSTSFKSDQSATGDDDKNERLAKDTVEGVDENSDSAESSGEPDDSSSDDEGSDIRKGPAKSRGRSKEKTEPSPGASPAPSPMPPGGWTGKRGPGPLPPGSPRIGGALSLFNELEEERKAELSMPLSLVLTGSFNRRTEWTASHSSRSKWTENGAVTRAQEERIVARSQETWSASSH
jgi:hypothetical protein